MARNSANLPNVDYCGVTVRLPKGLTGEALASHYPAILLAAEMGSLVEIHVSRDSASDYMHLKVTRSAADLIANGSDTLGLRKNLLRLPGSWDDALYLEILVAMLLGPFPVEYPSLGELQSAINMRANVVRAAENTVLLFGTETASRPTDCWHYDDDEGFILRPDASLVTALTKATQPGTLREPYSFSCYRATEYVILLGIAQEIQHCNVLLYAELESLWKRRQIKSAEFHEVFLRETGSMECPYPCNYYIPGDRVWFRNPDAASADISGYEGSWVIYLGDGLFSNFWKRNRPYTLDSKFLEIYHWRNSVVGCGQDGAWIDEQLCERLVDASLQQPDAVSAILALMGRYREPRGVYTSEGGCVDTTREFARWVRPGSCTIVLPPAES